MKVKIFYNGYTSTSVKEMEMPQIPNVGDGLSIRFEKDNTMQLECFKIESIDWYCTNGVVNFVELFLTDDY